MEADRGHLTCDLYLVALCYYGANLKQWRMANNERRDFVPSVLLPLETDLCNLDIYLKPKVTLHFELLNISLLFFI